MKKLRRTLCLILGCLTAFSPVTAVTARAGEEVKIQIGKETGEEGDRITIPISLKGSGVAGMDFTVIYDSRELAYVGAEKGECAKKGELCDINHIASEASVHYVYASNKAVAKSGEVLLLSFDVLEEGRKEHTVDVRVKKILDENIKELSYQIEGGRAITPPEGTGTEEKASQSGQSPQEGQTGQNSDASGDALSETDKNREREETQETPENKKRIVIKTKEGIKDVTDSIGEKTNENLLKEEQNKKAGRTGNTVIIVAGAVFGVILVACGYWIWKKKKQ